MRSTTSAAMTSASEKKQKQMAAAPSTSSETWGKPLRCSLAEDAEVVAVARRRVGDARVAEQQREHAGERRHHHQPAASLPSAGPSRGPYAASINVEITARRASGLNAAAPFLRPTNPCHGSTASTEMFIAR